MDHPNDVLGVARTLLERGLTAEAGACLRSVLRLEPANLAAHNLVEANRLEGNFTEAFGIEARISPDDDIFRFFAGHPSCTNPIRDYLADGWRTMVELNGVLEGLGRPLSRCASFLEFASGFGRFSRHLVKALPAGSLHVSDIVPGSVDFLKLQLGVQGFYSTPRPEVLEVPRKYEIIFVLSLFSHLPDATWGDWLVRLFGALEEGGVLIFTTHGEKAAERLGVSMPDDGYLFIPSSESTSLDGAEYGSTFTSADYVRRCVAERLGDIEMHEYPGHFWGMQDGFALVRRAAAKPRQGLIQRILGG